MNGLTRRLRAAMKRGSAGDAEFRRAELYLQGAGRPHDPAMAAHWLERAAALGHAVKIAPDNGAYHCLLADVYSEMRMDSHAIYHYQMAGHLDDYDAETLRRLRRLCGSSDA